MKKEKTIFIHFQPSFIEDSTYRLHVRFMDTMNLTSGKKNTTSDLQGKTSRAHRCENGIRLLIFQVLFKSVQMSHISQCASKSLLSHKILL